MEWPGRLGRTHRSAPTGYVPNQGPRRRGGPVCPPPIAVGVFGRDGFVVDFPADKVSRNVPATAITAAGAKQGQHRTNNAECEMRNGEALNEVNSEFLFHAMACPIFLEQSIACKKDPPTHNGLNRSHTRLSEAASTHCKRCLFCVHPKAPNYWWLNVEESIFSSC